MIFQARRIATVIFDFNNLIFTHFLKDSKVSMYALIFQKYSTTLPGLLSDSKKVSELKEIFFQIVQNGALLLESDVINIVMVTT